MASDDPENSGPDTPGSANPGPATRRPRRSVPPIIDATAKDVTPAEVSTSSATENSPAEEAVAAPVDVAPEPITADAVATDTETVGLDPADPSSGPSEKPSRLSPVAAGVLAGILAGMVGGGIVAGAAIAYFGPSESLDSLTDVEAGQLDLRQRIQKIEARPVGDPAAIGALSQRLDGVSNTLNTLEKRPAGVDPGLAGRITALETGMTAAADAASKAAAASLEAGQRPVATPEQLGALGTRIDGLETRLRELAATNLASDRTAAALVALGSLREAVLRGAPFEAELAAASAMLGDRGMALNSLKESAAKGFPSAAALARQLAEASGAALAVEQPKPEDGIVGRLLQSAGQLVKVSPAGDPEADAPASHLTRAGEALRRDDLDAALAEIAVLPTPVREALGEVTIDVEGRRAALVAIDALQQQALAALAGKTP